MYYADLQEFIDHLDTNGELLRYHGCVEPYLEVAALVNDVCKDSARNRALLFTQVKGSDLPLLANTFGSARRTAAALGVDHIDELSARLKRDLAATGIDQSDLALAELLRQQPGKVDAPGQSLPMANVECAKGLLELPVLQAWSKDGGPYITLGQVFTRHPEKDDSNCGMYRLQVIDQSTALIRFHPGSGGGEHLKAWHARGKAMPISVVLGGPPAMTWCAGLSLPEGLTETAFVSYLTGHRVALAKCRNSELSVPASAEVVIEGRINCGEELTEGPFGNHTGYYSPASPAPVLKVETVYRRDKAIYPCTLVGPPPMENSYLAKANERLLLALLQHDCPWVVDVNMPAAGIYHRAALVSLDAPAIPAALIKRSLGSSRLLRNSRMLVLLDKGCDLHNYQYVYWRFINADCWEKSVSIDGNTMIVDARTQSGRVPILG